jgi:hypothetical protein
MTIDPKITKVQPGDDRAMADQSTPVNMLSFDLETPDTAPDDYKRAAARRISTTIGAPDPDGRMWRPDQQGFATGSEYLDFMRGMLKSGDIFEYAATPELKEFSKADPAARLAIAKKARSFTDTAADTISKAVTPEGYGLPDGDPKLSGAPQDVIEANGRMRMRKEAVSLGDSGPTPEETADRAAVDAWRAQRDDAALVNGHHEKLLEKNVWHLYLALSPSLSDKGRAIAANAFKDRKLAGSDIADFQRLDEKEQAVIAKLARASRNPVAGTLFNTLGDAGIGFLNGILMTPVKATRQLQTIDSAIFGNLSGLTEAEALNRRARTEQRLMEALDDPAGINPSGAEHGYVSRALIGAASTIPYMAYASIPYVGAATVGLDFMQQLDERIAQSGGDVHGKGPEWMAQKAIYGALYAGIEKVSALPIFKESSDIALKMMFIKLATKHGAAAAEKVALHVGKDTFVESLEESAQRVIEEHAVSVGLDKGPGWREAVKGGINEFAESLGTMGIISTVGATRQGIAARSLRGRQSLAEFTTDSLRRESFLLSENPYAGQSGTEQRDKAIADVHAQLNTYRSAWESGGIAALEKRRDLSPEEAAVLGSLFEADNERAAVENFIAGRNIVSRTQAAEAGAPSLDATPESIRELVSTSGGDAAAQLEQMGFTSDGAARVSSYFQQETSYNKRAARVLDDIRASLARDWADPDASAQRADEAQAAADPLQPLRSLYQRAGTRDGAVKAFTDIGFTPQQAQGMAAAFHEERALATSPQAAAAFRAFYLDTSEEETAATRLQRLTGFESAPAPDQGDGAARLTLRDTDGTVRGSILYLPGQAEAFDPESEHAGEAVQQATGGIITATDWAALTPEQRRQTAQDMGIRADGGFIVTDEADPSVRADGAQADLLTGRLTLAPDAPSATLYHEAAHAWLAVMRQAGKLTDADVQKLQAAYGVAPDNKDWFNEEAMADDIREMAAAADFTPDRPLAARFLQAVRTFAGTARTAEAQRTAATGARQALYESIVYGRAFDGVGDFNAAQAQPKADSTAAPVAGASTATVPKTEPAAESGTADTQPVKNQVTAASQKQDKSTAPNARKRVDWTAATPQGNLRVGGYWLIAPRDKFISDTDPRYDGSLQGRTRDATSASAEQVAAIASPGGLDPLRLMDAPDTANGAPVVIPVTLKNPDTGKDEEYYMVISGNGRFRALDKIDADNRGDEYRNPVKLFADERNIPYAPSDMTAEARPRLVRVITRKPVDSTLQQIATLSNQNAVLQMTDSEQASADAELIGRDNTAGLFSANKDGLPSKTGSDAFFAWFARATGDASLIDSKGNPTQAARDRARRAMLAFAIGSGENGKATVMAFTENADALGLDRQRDALLMSAGTLSSLGNMKPEYSLAEELSRSAAAMLAIARDRKAGKTATAETFLQQGDMLNPLPAATAAALRILDSSRPAEGIAEAFRRYADLAAKIDTETPDMFGEPPTPKDALLQKAFDDTAVPEGIRYSIALAARRYALSVNMPAEGEKLLARQLEFLFSRQMDPEYREKTEAANRKRQATVEGKRKDAEDKRLHGIRNATAEALNNPGSPEAWQQAFDKAGDTVSRIIHDFFIQDGPQRFPQTYAGKSIIGLKVNDSHDVAALLMPLRNPYQESSKVIFLDEKNRVLGAQVVTVGILNAAPIHARELFKKGILLGATKFVFSHNHPGGDPSPSKEDREMTDRITASGRILGIEYFDHIITNGNTFYSFKDGMVRTVAGETPNWEAIPAGTGDKIEKAYDAASLANVLRQSQGDYIHAILLDTRNRIAGVHRMPYDPKTTTPAIVARSVFKAAAGNATNAIILDLTAEGITRETAQSLHQQIKEQSRIMGMDLYDSIYQEQGWASSITYNDKQAGLVLPLTSKAAESSDTRYSLSSAPYGRTSEGKQIDADYMAAVQRGDMETAQKMADDAAKAAGYIPLYHGTTKQGYASIMQTGVLKPNKEPAVYLTTDSEVNGYGDGTIMRLAAKEDRLEIDDEFPGGRQDYRAEVGYAGTLKVKLADAVTRDKSGNVIPLSQRFDSKNNDIRYSLTAAPSPAIRYALDVTGRAYAKEDVLKAWMAHAVMTGSSFPSKNTVARLAENIGVQSFDYETLASSARALAASTEDEAIRKAAASADPGKTAYAIGELARQSARAYVRSGAREGARLARSADQIRGLSENTVRQAMQLMTGADYADIETDTAIDVAMSILAADPKKFDQQQQEAAAALVAAAGANAEAAPAEPSAAIEETDEEAPELTDKQRAEIARKRKEREARIQGYLDAAAKRGARNRFRDEERRNRTTANDKAARAEQAAAGADGASGEFVPELTPEQQEAAAAIPVNFADRWEAAAFLRVWALDRFSRDNPNRSRRDIAKDRLAVEFYRKTAVRELTALARKLLEPGYPRETVISMIGDIVPNLSANQIERRTAHVFGLINRHAVREARQSLVKKFRAEVKRQFIKGAIFEELGVDLGRVLTGAVEEDARYVMRVCELSDRVFSGNISALQEERNRLNAILAEREAMTDSKGEPLSVGSDDMQLRLAHRQLGLLDKYGGMVDMMPGEILDLTGTGLANFAQEAVALRERWEAYDKLVASIRDPLAAAIGRNIGDPKSIETFSGSLADNLTGMLRLRLDFLTRYAEPGKREAARAAIADFMDLLARGNTDFAIALQDDEAAFNRALSEIFVRPDGKPDRSRIRAYLKRLDDKIPYELSMQLTRQGMQGHMTYGQMLQLLASLDQWASYKDNIIRHDRKGQAGLIRSFVYADTKTGETRSALTNEDTQLLEWLRRRFYNDKRAAISVVTERIAGRPVDSPDPLYHPVRMLQQKKEGMHQGEGGAWQPLAGVFSRRVKNKLDFDETASILDVFHSRSRETALLTAFSERGMVIREILTSSQFQDAVKNFHGPDALSRILKQTEQTLNGGRSLKQTDAQTAAAVIAMRATTYVGLGWNFMSAAKQTVSLPVFANVMGFKKLLSILGGPIDKDVIRRLKESDEYRIRYGTGPASGMDIGTKAAYDSPKTSAFKTFFADWGLAPNRKVDWFISAWVGQGIYRDLKASYLDKGMSEEEADRRAISETFSVIEETQQSGRTENTTALTREYGVLGKMVTQFATSPLQQMQYEIKSFREWRDLAANNGPEANTLEARNRFMRALIINHVIVPGAMTAVAALFKAATGDEPEWDKEGFWWTVLIASLIGQFGRIFFIGALTEESLRSFFLRERPRMGQLVPAEGAVRFTANLILPVRDIVTWDEKNFKADIMRALKSTAATRLPIKLYENYVDPAQK